MTGRLLAAITIFGVAAGGWYFLGSNPGPATVTLQHNAVAQANADRLFLDARQQADSLQTALGEPVKSVLIVGRRMNYGDYVWRDHGVPQGPVWIRVDLKSQLISVFRAGHEIGTSVILYGATEKQTPAGVFPILAKMRDHESSTYNALMPYTLRLTGDGVSIHGSDVRWGAATHGCIGVPIAFARRLFDEVTTGSKVLILRNSAIAPAPTNRAGDLRT